ncbi:MAG TPA: sugar transferase [bacterium]|nr:sugar transferase [bacterium]HPN45601.1 sugar transferase [bacterium]
MKWMLGIKTVLDVIFGIILLILLLPVFILIAVSIKIDSKGPVFFKQKRIGKDEKPFVIYKFRSMVNNAEKIGLGLNLCKDDFRITRVGKFLRDWSFDELPQLINIVIGDMSFIGPRPTLDYQVAAYNDIQRKRLKVKPGVTGWAQVNGRNSLTWAERIEYDVWYVDNYSLWLDLVILFRTFKVALMREGLYGKDGMNDDFV